MKKYVNVWEGIKKKKKKKKKKMLIPIVFIGNFANLWICTFRIIVIIRQWRRCIWVKVFKNGPSMVCGRQPLKSLKWYGLLRQKTVLELFNCGGCKNYMVVTSDECTKSNYLELLSRGRLTIPSMQTADFLVVFLYSWFCR